MPKTAAQQQIEMLKQMKRGRLKGPQPGVDEALEGASDFPRAAPAPAPKLKSGHSLPVGDATWKKLLERQRSGREFRGKKDMGDWAAQLLLAFPPKAHGADAQGREELLQSLRAWAAARSAA
jgi:hypothetical protein